jgi:long-chain fatty acid transport protein
MKHVMRRQSSSQKQAAIIAVVLGLGAAVGSMSVFGLGLAVPDQDAFATARGNAFVATANDPAAVFYNPAGISQLGGANVSLGAYGIVLGDRYSSGKDSVDSKTEWSILPQVFSTYSLSNYNFTFGLGVYSPYGLRMEWPTSAPFLAAGETAQVSYLRAAGIISWQIVPSFSIAAGPNLNYSDADLKEFPGFVNHFAGRATDAGYTAGILYHPWEQHYFGLTTAAQPR